MKNTKKIRKKNEKRRNKKLKGRKEEQEYREEEKGNKLRKEKMVDKITSHNYTDTSILMS